MITSTAITSGTRQRYLCSICGIGCGYKRSLDRHMKLHTGERPFRCSECSNSFSRKDHLRVHEKMHIKKQPQQDGAQDKRKKQSQQQLKKKTIKSQKNYNNNQNSATTTMTTMAMASKLETPPPSPDTYCEIEHNLVRYSECRRFDTTNIIGNTSSSSPLINADYWSSPLSGPSASPMVIDLNQKMQSNAIEEAEPPYHYYHYQPTRSTSRITSFTIESILRYSPQRLPIYQNL